MITSEFEGEYNDHSLLEFETYEDYLDSFIEGNDRKYLSSIEIARQLIELGIHSKTQILKKEQFEAKLKAIKEARDNQNSNKIKELTHKLVPPSMYEKDDFLKEIANREDEVINGKLMVIIFIRAIKRKPKIGGELKQSKPVETKYDKNDIRYLKKQKRMEEEEEWRRREDDKDNEEIQLKELNEEGIEISGYIDLAHRLRTEDFTQYFKGQKLLLPKNTDLSYYNWNTGVCVYTDSPNFKVDASNGAKGLLFRNKRDRKVINVEPPVTETAENLKDMKTLEGGKSTKSHMLSSKEKAELAKNAAADADTTKRIKVTSLRSEYKQIVIFDHYTRRKT